MSTPTAAADTVPPPTKLTTIQLLRGLGGGRYAFAALVSAVGGGLMRPFLLLYAVTISGLSVGGCADRPLTLLGGDEMSRASFGIGRHQIMLPPKLTVYYTTFNHLPNLVANGRDRTNPFFVLARGVLNIDGPAETALLADGQMALTYDGTSALAQAAQNAYTTLGLPGRAKDRTAGSSVVTSVEPKLSSCTQLPKTAASSEVGDRSAEMRIRASRSRAAGSVRLGQAPSAAATYRFHVRWNARIPSWTVRRSAFCEGESAASPRTGPPSSVKPISDPHSAFTHCSTISGLRVTVAATSAGCPACAR